MRFVSNCQKRSSQKSSLSSEELKGAEIYWLELIQTQHFLTEIEKKGSILKSSSLLPLQPSYHCSLSLILQPIFYVLVADSNCLKFRIRVNILSYYMGKIRSHMQSSEIMSMKYSFMQAQLCCPFLFVGDTTSLVVGRRSDQICTRECLISEDQAKASDPSTASLRACNPWSSV